MTHLQSNEPTYRVTCPACGDHGVYEAGLAGAPALCEHPASSYSFSPVMPEEVHTAHFYGGPWDGEVKDLRPFVPTVLVPLEGTMGVYRHAYAMGSSNPAECRDHVFRYAGERER